MGTITRAVPEAARARRAEAGSDSDDFIENGLVGLQRFSREGTILWANRAQYEPLGYTADEYLGHDVREFHEDPALIDQLLERVAAGQEVRGLESVMRCRDGAQTYVLLAAVARFDEQGRFIDARSFSQDISERRRSELRERDELLRHEQQAHERLAVLAKASDALADTLDYERILETVSKLGIPLLGDFSCFELLENDTVRSFAHASEGEVAASLLTALARPRADLEGETNLDDRAHGKVKSTLQTHVNDASLRELAAGPEQLALLQQLRVCSMVTVPLVYQNEPLGALSFFFAASQRQHTEQDLSLAEELARRASAAIVNARLFKEARDAIGVRDDFLSMAGHELRTPLTALQLQILSISKMVNQPDGAEKVAARAEKAARNVLRLSALVNELLDISRISAGRLRLERGAMDMGEAVREVLHRHADELNKNGCEVHFTSTGDVTGNWDRVRIEQIATNLIANALKYGKGKPIEVRVQHHEGNARLIVQDHGIGISPEDQRRIFQRFERAVSSRHFGGLGLGLWIARQLIDAHGGTIRVQSEMNQGATFEVELPLKAPSPNEHEVGA